MRVCFTGPAMDGNGKSINRADLIDACHEFDLIVHSSVRTDTELLVASRTDTTKAKNAAKRGVKVIGYPEFINRVLGGTEIKSSGRLNLFTDYAKSLASELMVPDFTTSTTLAAIDQL
ncbi:hypothetical protein [Hyphomicrobium sp. ghe19]|uniref:hypothetical protein n=1 Tax=Hyphomicrobium sp. ghe19 TaxID=2682968 RepID=UPI00136772C8|nr:hypothetical protein HYPP_02456 [Hyphomicrobium sp. ghe19]